MKQVTIAINELQQSQMSLIGKFQPKIRELKGKGLFLLRHVISFWQITKNIEVSITNLKSPSGSKGA